MTSTTKRRALIIVSSARQMPLAEPKDVGSVSTGYMHVELAQVLKEFENDYEFTFATPDGNVPQLDINGMALATHAIENLVQMSAALDREQRRTSFDIDRFRQRHADLVARREQEVQLLERHLGRLPVSDVLPRTDREAAAFRPELLQRLAALEEKTYHSVEELVRRHNDPADEFSFADFDFVHVPGGHGAMVDFRDHPWIGEVLDRVRENGAVLSLICHGPIALTSTWQRVDSQGEPHRIADNPFSGAKITVWPKSREESDPGYVAVPGRRTRLVYFVEDALEDAGFTVQYPGPDPIAPTLVHDPAVGLLTGNGPHTIDQQADKIRSLLSARPPGPG